ncbi:MAG: rubrerythrin [Thermotogae bacterium]|nr:MAG: rubrerythrin [Thermotogota bacterium]
MNEKIIGILKFALVREREGMEFYRDKKHAVKTPNVRETFETLEEMERQHVNYIMSLIENVSRGDEINITSLPPMNIFVERTKTELKGISIDNVVGDLSVLRTAYLIEKDFADFYSDAAKKADSEKLRQIFNDLARWEREHQQNLFKLYNDLMKEYWGDQGFTPLY